MEGYIRHRKRGGFGEGNETVHFRVGQAIAVIKSTARGECPRLEQGRINGEIDVEGAVATGRDIQRGCADSDGDACADVVGVAIADADVVALVGGTGVDHLHCLGVGVDSADCLNAERKRDVTIRRHPGHRLSSIGGVDVHAAGALAADWVEFATRLIFPGGGDGVVHQTRLDHMGRQGSGTTCRFKQEGSSAGHHRGSTRGATEARITLLAGTGRNRRTRGADVGFEVVQIKARTARTAADHCVGQWCANAPIQVDDGGFIGCLSSLDFVARRLINVEPRDGDLAKERPL